MKKSNHYAIELMKRLQEHHKPYVIFSGFENNWSGMVVRQDDGWAMDYVHLSYLRDKGFADTHLETAAAWMLSEDGHDFLGALDNGRLDLLVERYGDDFDNVPLDMISSAAAELVEEKFSSDDAW